jgi:hypothetical protein
VSDFLLFADRDEMLVRFLLSPFVLVFVAGAVEAVVVEIVVDATENCFLATDAATALTIWSLPERDFFRKGAGSFDAGVFDDDWVLREKLYPNDMASSLECMGSFSEYVAVERNRKKVRVSNVPKDYTPLYMYIYIHSRSEDTATAGFVSARLVALATAES